MSGGWWPSYEMRRELETENFYLYDKKTKSPEDVIKVFPSLSSKVSGVKRKVRNTVTDTTIFGIVMAIYNRECEMIYEGDKISIFGKLTYDMKNDEFAFDRTYGMFKGSKTDMLRQLNGDWWLNACYTVSLCILIAAFSWSTYLGISMFRN